MNKYELVYDLKEHLDTYSQTYDDYIMSYGEADMIYHYIEEKDKEIERLTKQNKALNEMYELTKKEYIRLNNIINELNHAYCKVITKCEEMIDSRFYMNDIAIKKYANEIKDICKYYVGEAKELKGSDKE